MYRQCCPDDAFGLFDSLGVANDGSTVSVVKDRLCFHVALSEVHSEGDAKGNAQSDSEDDIGEALAVGALHGVPFALDGAGAPG